ncbi:hypothetical protein HHJ03_06980 [Akkermansia muciniphila]|uniref:hypothetical protein n=1 Tax=Akkermansia sp. JRP_AM1 TaxID=3414159 RepID=UPI0011AF9EC6|nr:hypothetical protein [Akkermansia muciniphila]
MREKTRLTLSNLAELSGYSVLHIVRLENGGDVSSCMRDKILSILLQTQEEGMASEVKIWRDRALQAEEKLCLLKDAMVGWIKKI